MRGRKAAHMRKPPVPLRTDFAAVGGFRQPGGFTMQAEGGPIHGAQAAHCAERALIGKLSLTDPAKGYNTLRATPAQSTQFWGMHYARRAAGKQRG